MKIGIIGLPQSGKKTLFQVLTNTNLSQNHDVTKPIMGMAMIRDERFDKLVAMYAPQKQMPAKTNFVVLPKLETETLKDVKTFVQIDDVDLICFVVRTFEDESIYHVDGSVNAKRDLLAIHAELILHDLIFVEKRIERLTAQVKKTNSKEDQRELELMQKMKTCLENEQPLRTLTFSDEELKNMSGYPLITLKPMIVILNGEDDSCLKTEAGEKSLEELLQIDVISVSAQLEAEISLLETKEEQEMFLKEMGIAKPAIERLTLLCLSKLGLMSFFTVGKDEVKQWLVRRNALAPQAAGVIHSDLERGFIKAEIMKYDDLMLLKSEQALKEAGKYYLKGKDYQLCDGDIMNVLFNV